LVRQQSTVVSVSFDDVAVAEFFDDQVDSGRSPEQFARIWIHTHPGECPLPSEVDEETFDRVFGRCDWAVMFILAQHGRTYCRLRFRAGPGGAFEIPVGVDFRREFPQSDFGTWAQEYTTAVSPVKPYPSAGFLGDEAEFMALGSKFDDFLDIAHSGKGEHSHERAI
jgi:proteasome lid subunit RPN8/RPN11